MTKLEFISSLRNKLSGIPAEELDERISFYAEAIDDRIEDGLSEEDAVADVGSVDSIAAEILNEIPLSRLVKDKIKPKRKPHAWEIALIAAGFPVWLPLLISAVAVIVSIYVSVWAIIISLWSIFVSIAACAIGSLGLTVSLFLKGSPLSAIAFIGAAIFLSGISILSFIGCREATKGILIFTKKAAIGIKKCFIKKEESI